MSILLTRSQMARARAEGHSLYARRLAEQALTTQRLVVGPLAKLTAHLDMQNGQHQHHKSTTATATTATVAVAVAAGTMVAGTGALGVSSPMSLNKNGRMISSIHYYTNQLQIGSQPTTL